MLTYLAKAHRAEVEPRLAIDDEVRPGLFKTPDLVACMDRGSQRWPGRAACSSW